MERQPGPMDGYDHRHDGAVRTALAFRFGQAGKEPTRAWHTLGAFSAWLSVGLVRLWPSGYRGAMGLSHEQDAIRR